MTKQYKTNFDEFNVPKRKFNNDNDGLYRAQEIVSPHPIETGRYEKNFSSTKRKYYKRDKDFTPEERSQILARVSEVGATRAADEFGTRRWVIMQWLDNLEKFGVIDHPNHKNKKYKNKKHSFVPQKNSSDNSLGKEDKTQKPDFKDFKFNFEGISEQDEQPVKTQENISLKAKLKTSSDFTLEERIEILKLADKIGIKKAALEVHTKIDVIKYWRKLSRKSAKSQPAVSLIAENKLLKAKLADLKEQMNELTEKILSSISNNKDK